MSEYVLKGADGVMRALNDIVEKMGDGELKVGFFENATYPDGTPVAAVAYWNEFGVPTRKQPPRPFFRQMIAQESPEWPRKMAALAKLTNYDGKKTLGLMGEDIKGALQQSINNFTTPELAPSTAKRKGFPKPLIETAQMLNSVGYEVSE